MTSIVNFRTHVLGLFIVALFVWTVGCGEKDDTPVADVNKETEPAGDPLGNIERPRVPGIAGKTNSIKVPPVPEFNFPPGGKPPGDLRASAPGALEPQLSSGRDEDHGSMKYITVAVTDFDNHSMDKALDGFRLGFRDMLVTSLTQISSIRVVERARLQALLDEHDLSKSRFIDADNVVKLGRGLSANQIVTGAFTILDDQIRIDIRVISVETGEVGLAESILGRKNEVFSLQTALSEKVLKGLSVVPTAVEEIATGVPQVSGFQAFSEYSTARLLQIQGNNEQAQQRLVEALKLDPDSELASTELNRRQSKAVFRISSEKKQAALATEEVKVLLAGHLQEHEKIIALQRVDSEYFASLLVLSAYHGLWGDFERERRSLWEFWRQFSEAVDPSDASDVVAEVLENIKDDALFFQENIHSGYYGTVIALFDEVTAAREACLKDPLIDLLYWPKWSKIFPFNDRARTVIGMIQNNPGLKDPLEAEAKRHIPTLPHHFLSAFLHGSPNFSRSGDEPFDRGGDEYWAFLSLKVDILFYLAKIPDPSPELVQDINRLMNGLLSEFESTPPQKWELAVLRKASKSLEFIATAASRSKKRQEANELFVRFVDQLKIEDGISTTQNGVAQTKNAFGFPFAHERVEFFWHIEEGVNIESSSLNKELLAGLSDVIRRLPESTDLNFHFAGERNPRNKDIKESVFEVAQPATVENKSKLLDVLAEGVPNSFDVDLGVFDFLLPPLVDKTTKKMVVVLVIPHSDKIKISAATSESMLKSKNTTFYVLANTEQRELLKWTMENKIVTSVFKFHEDRGLFGGWEIIPHIPNH